MLLFAAILPLPTLRAEEDLAETSVIDVLGESIDPPTPPAPSELDNFFAQIQDPAIETVDEQTRRPGTGGGRSSGSGDGAPGNVLKDRWDKIRDPAIETVDEQTHSDKKEDKKKKRVVRANQHPWLHAVPDQQRALER